MFKIEFQNIDKMATHLLYKPSTSIINITGPVKVVLENLPPFKRVSVGIHNECGTFVSFIDKLKVKSPMKSDQDGIFVFVLNEAPTCQNTNSKWFFLNVTWSVGDVEVSHVSAPFVLYRRLTQNFDVIVHDINLKVACETSFSDFMSKSMIITELVTSDPEIVLKGRFLMQFVVKYSNMSIASDNDTVLYTFRRGHKSDMINLLTDTPSSLFSARCNRISGQILKSSIPSSKIINCPITPIWRAFETSRKSLASEALDDKCVQALQSAVDLIFSAVHEREPLRRQVLNSLETMMARRIRCNLDAADEGSSPVAVQAVSSRKYGIRKRIPVNVVVVATSESRLDEKLISTPFLRHREQDHHSMDYETQVKSYEYDESQLLCSSPFDSDRQTLPSTQNQNQKQNEKQAPIFVACGVLGLAKKKTRLETESCVSTVDRLTAMMLGAPYSPIAV